jgi:hypothetical protein
MPDFTPSQIEGLCIAHNLVDMGVPVFSAPPNSSRPGEFHYPSQWQHFKPNHVQVDRWRPGWALAMVCGVVFDVIDVDPRDGGDIDQIPWPRHYGLARTPSAGEHYLIGRTHLAKCKPAKGIDLQAGDDHGEGRGFIFIAPTVRVSRFGQYAGEPVEYRWEVEPTGHPDILEADPGLAALIDLCKAQQAPRRTIHVATSADAPDLSEDDWFVSAGNTWTRAEADRVIEGQQRAVMNAREGQVNGALGGAARVLGRFVAGGYLDENTAARKLMEALDRGGVHSDAWNVANGKSWTMATVIGAGLARGAEEPWTVEAPASQVTTAHGVSPLVRSTGTTPPEPDASVRAEAYPPLLVQSPAEMAYWLQGSLGLGSLSGFFLRGGQVVHTPRVDEAGYVAPKDGKDDDNGPAQIQPVTPGTLAAKIQFAHRCYKMADRKDEAGKKTGEQYETPAMFPLGAAQRAVDAPEAMGGLRRLAGITHTPMVRSDGTVFGMPGFDAASGYLFLPGAGVKTDDVPDVPDASDVSVARGYLDEMTAGFPWGSDDDRANYYGLLLTPLLRQLAPPSYKLFGITAHQPGSGKTLLADVARIIHGGVLRSEMPDDEAEVKKMSTALLVGTAAPVVHVDNITGVLKSSVLAGLLTSDGVIQDRELGASRMLSYINDRVWVVTGNNLSLGGDLVRRTVLIEIDPNMANPEERQFAIADLKGWVREHRNELLWSLLVLVRHWVAQGSVVQARKQSDSYAAWESIVGGILAAAGIPGAFDAKSGQKAATGGDDEATAGVLEHLWSKLGGKAWVVAKALEPGDAEGWVAAVENLDWLPSSVLDKLSRSIAAGRKTFGYWLSNRVGRWVTGSDGHAYVIRRLGKTKHGQEWQIERSG